MSAWLVLLGVSAAYLIHKNMQHGAMLDEAMQEFNSAAKPADGLQTEQIRAAQRTVDAGTVNGDINVPQLPIDDTRALIKAQNSAAQVVSSYEGPPIEIEGFYLMKENTGA